MVVTDDTPPAVLVVTGPMRERLAELFTRVFEGRHDVRVVMERRAGERREASARVALERRRGERRVSAPWLVIPPS
jgi:hypothetical protein